MIVHSLFVHGQLQEHHCELDEDQVENPFGQNEGGTTSDSGGQPFVCRVMACVPLEITSGPCAVDGIVWRYPELSACRLFATLSSGSPVRKLVAGRIVVMLLSIDDSDASTDAGMEVSPCGAFGSREGQASHVVVLVGSMSQPVIVIDVAFSQYLVEPAVKHETTASTTLVVWVQLLLLVELALDEASEPDPLGDGEGLPSGLELPPGRFGSGTSPPRGR